MSGWLEDLPSGSVRAVYRDTSDKRHSRTFRTRKEAKAFLSSVVTDLARGQWIDPRGGQVLFADWSATWSAARFVRITTHANQQAALRNHVLPRLGHRPLKDITPLVIRSFVQQLGTVVGPKTVRNVFALVSTILRDAVLEGLLLSNPCVGIRLPKGKPFEAVFLSPEQIDMLVEATDPHHRPLVLTAAYTGLRWGELAGLTRPRLDLLRKQLRVEETLIDVNGQISFGEPKTSQSRRTVSLPPSLVSVLARHLEGHSTELVFTSESGEPLRRSNFWNRVWKPAVTAAAFDPAPRFHDLRHSHVAMLISAGVPIKAIQQRLGHASIVMTMDRYGHVLPEVDDKLVLGLEANLTGTLDL